MFTKVNFDIYDKINLNGTYFGQFGQNLQKWIILKYVKSFVLHFDASVMAILNALTFLRHLFFVLDYSLY